MGLILNFTQITTFRAVMTSASLSEAAKKLGRTQPAVSLAIRSLEDSLGLKLFERRGRHLTPVPEAKYLLEEAEEILDRLAMVARTMKSLAVGQSGSLNVSAMPGAIFLFSRFISQAIDPHATVKLAISARSSLRIQELVSSQSLDFGFGDAPGKMPVNPQFTARLLSGACFCAMPRGHRLSGHSQVSIRDLDQESIGVLQASHAHHRRTLAAFERAGAGYRTFVESQTFAPLLQFVRAGHCVSIVDPLTLLRDAQMNGSPGDVIFKPLSDTIRYDYAVLSPNHRPLSQLAVSMRAAWVAELYQCMVDIGADPVLEQAS